MVNLSEFTVQNNTKLWVWSGVRTRNGRKKESVINLPFDGMPLNFLAKMALNRMKKKRTKFLQQTKQTIAGKEEHKNAVLIHAA